MKKKLVAAVLTTAFLSAGTGAAFAGEITGNGKITPIEDRGVGASFCAYSGLDDGGGPGQPPQSFGQDVKLEEPGSKAGVGADGPFAGPGGSTIGCNAHLYPRP